MKKQILQDIKLSIPILVAPAADVSHECESLMKYLCRNSVEINVKKNDIIYNASKKLNVSPPQVVRTHPIFCPTFSDLVSYANVLSEEKHHFFLKSYSILAFIDYSKNKDMKSIKNLVCNFPVMQNERISFAVFHADEELKDNNDFLELFSDLQFLPCICSKRLGEIDCYFYILDYLSNVASANAAFLLNDGLTKSEIQPKTLREYKTRADFAAVTKFEYEFIRQIKNALGEIGKNCSPAFLASFYEIMGMYDEIKTGALAENKIPSPTNLKSPFKWTPSNFVDNNSSLSLQYYIAAAYQYNENIYREKCVDVGIRIILMDHKEIIQPVVDYITTYFYEKGSLSRAWDLLFAIRRFGLNRRAAIIASLFSKIYSNEVSYMFTIFALEMIMKNTNGNSLGQIRDLGFPMVISLLESKLSFPQTIISNFISRMICSIGPLLDFQHQEMLFHELERLGCDEINLPLVVDDVLIEKPQFSIKSDTSSSNSGGFEDPNKSVFIYSYIQKNKESSQNVRVTSAVNSILIVKFIVKNPLSIALEFDDVIAKCEGCICKPSHHYIAPSIVNTIHCNLTPTYTGTFSIEGFEFTVFGAKQSISLEKPITFDAIEKVPRFSLRTDLPLSTRLSLLEGEIKDFTLWVTNTGTEIITNITVDFLVPDISHVVEQPSLPLLPGNNAIIHCQLTAAKEEEYINFTVNTYSSSSQYYCTQSMRQYYDIQKSLRIARVFLMRRPPPNPTKNSDSSSDDKDENFADYVNSLYVGYEVRNDTDNAFQYNAIISNNSINGILGARESILTVGTYKTSELKTDGSDAKRNRVIALTKVKEEMIGRSLLPAERIKVAKEVSIMQRLESKWQFNWQVSTYRRGILSPKAIVIDDALFMEVESRQIQPSIQWIKPDNNTDKDLQAFKVNKLSLDFGENKIKECVLDLNLIGLSLAKSGILWEGSLEQHDQEGKSKYDFTLSFSKAGIFKMVIKFISISGMCSETPIIVNVIE